MDAGGKDGLIRQVMVGLNPQGVRVTSFKVPNSKEVNHDFLWRIHQAVPSRGEIGIFNRSHYEDVLVVRVHDIVPKRVWSRRYDEINAFERMLADNGVVVKIGRRHPAGPGWSDNPLPLGNGGSCESDKRNREQKRKASHLSPRAPGGWTRTPEGALLT
jgi:hypothetical protein